MGATWRALPAWPYPARPHSADLFRSGWAESLKKLEQEIDLVGGSDVVIGLVLDPSLIGFGGNLKAGWYQRIQHAGVEVSFERSDLARLAFHTDAFDNVTANLRAIALGMEALRKVDRYGITSKAEQYAGFAMLPPGGPDPEQGRRLVERHGSLDKALKATHPDRGGDPHEFAHVVAYRDRERG